MTYNHVFDQLVTALSEKRRPNFNNLKSEDVEAAFKSIFLRNADSTHDIDSQWLNILKERVFTASWSFFMIEEIFQVEDWPCSIINGSVLYLKLVNTRTKKPVMYFYIRPTEDPIRVGEATVKSLIRFGNQNR